MVGDSFTIREVASSPEDEALLAAKMVGRWQSGAPLVLSPDHDDPALGADPQRNNAYLYYDDDLLGFKCPAGSHARRMNPRDAFKGDGSVDVRLHRMIRRGTSYGPPLPEGVLEDDGADRDHSRPEGLTGEAVEASFGHDHTGEEGGDYGGEGRDVGAVGPVVHGPCEDGPAVVLDDLGHESETRRTLGRCVGESSPC